MWERGGRTRWAEERRPTAHIVSTSSRGSISGGGSPNGQSIAQQSRFSKKRKCPLCCVYRNGGT